MHFAWWDGDYCCIRRLEILCPSKNGEFSPEILPKLEKHLNCKHHKRGNEKIVEMHTEAFKKIISR